MRVDLQARPLAVFALATTPVLCCIVGLVIFARKCGDFEIDHPDPRCWTGVHPPTLIAEVPAAHQPDPALHACTAVAARRINDRYRLAVTPSNRLDEAGVVITTLIRGRTRKSGGRDAPRTARASSPSCRKGCPASESRQYSVRSAANAEPSAIASPPPRSFAACFERTVPTDASCLLSQGTPGWCCAPTRPSCSVCLAPMERPGSFSAPIHRYRGCSGGRRESSAWQAAGTLRRGADKSGYTAAASVALIDASPTTTRERGRTS